MTSTPSPAQQAEDARILSTLVDMLNAQVDALVPECLPRAVKSGNRWEIGSIEGDPGASMSIWRNTGIWKDYNPGNRRESGDMLDLVTHCLFAGRKGDAIAHYKSLFGLDSKDPERVRKTVQEAAEAKAALSKRQTAEIDQKRKRAAALFFGGADAPSPFLPGTPAAAYLRGRGIDFEALAARTGQRIVPRALRYRPDVWCAIRRDHAPAMLAGIFDNLTGEFLAVHRTYLDIRSWDPATGTGDVVALKVSTHKDMADRQIVPRDADGPKKTYKLSMGLFAGRGTIPLWKGGSPAPLKDCAKGEGVWISEGIEDALAWVMKRPECRTHAAVSLSNMGGVAWPEQIGRLTLLSQNDAPGSDAMQSWEQVVRKQQAAGRMVFDQRPPAHVKDWAELIELEAAA